MSDILKAGLLCAGTIVAVLLWVHRSKQTKVSHSVGTSVNIALRIVVLHIGFALLLCGSLKIPFNVLLYVLPFVYMATYAISLENFPAASDVVEAALVLSMTLPFYVIQQFVLGFPDRHEMVLKPPKLPRDDDPPTYASDTGVVVAMLRPMGQVKLAGERYSAASVDGKMVDVGTTIRVCGHRGKVLLVAKSDDSNT
jgi:membrane-bound ClpP family serine protease